MHSKVVQAQIGPRPDDAELTNPMPDGGLPEYLLVRCLVLGTVTLHPAR